MLAYSGGLDTSVILTWLKEHYDCEVIAYCADVGQGKELNGLEEKALATGASACYIEDLRESFVIDYVWPAIKANAVYEKRYLLGTSLARPCIAQRHIEIARKTGADAVAHGATGKGNDQVRFELAFKALAPDISIIAPWREWNLNSRTALIDYAKKHGIDIPVSKEKPYSMDANLLHISYEGGTLEDPWADAPDAMWQLTTAPLDAPDAPQDIIIGFEQGIPVSIDGTRFTSATALLEKANEIAGIHGVGRIDIVENRLVGMKSRGCYETPGGTLLLHAHHDIETLTLDRDTMHYKHMLELEWAQRAYNGTWFDPLMQALNGFIDATQKHVTGEVRLRLYKGSITTKGRRSAHSLFDENLATFEASTYDHTDATGFINLFGLPTKVYAERHSHDQ